MQAGSDGRDCLPSPCPSSELFSVLYSDESQQPSTRTGQFLFGPKAGLFLTQLENSSLDGGFSGLNQAIRFASQPRRVRDRGDDAVVPGGASRLAWLTTQSLESLDVFIPRPRWPPLSFLLKHRHFQLPASALPELPADMHCHSVFGGKYSTGPEH